MGRKVQAQVSRTLSVLLPVRGKSQPGEAPLTHPVDLFYSHVPVPQPRGLGPKVWLSLSLFKVLGQVALSLPTSPRIVAHQQSLNPISPNPVVPPWGCGWGWAGGLRGRTPGEAWWACGAVRGLAGDLEIGRVQALAAWITAQFRFSALSYGGERGSGTRGRRPTPESPQPVRKGRCSLRARLPRGSETERRGGARGGEAGGGLGRHAQRRREDWEETRRWG